MAREAHASVRLPLTSCDSPCRAVQTAWMRTPCTRKYVLALMLDKQPRICRGVDMPTCNSVMHRAHLEGAQAVRLSGAR